MDLQGGERQSTKPQPQAVKVFYSTKMADSQTLPYTPQAPGERGWMGVSLHTHPTTSWPCIAAGSHSSAD